MLPYVVLATFTDQGVKTLKIYQNGSKPSNKWRRRLE
jgi:uncharacterized protein with GYD domain